MSCDFCEKETKIIRYTSYNLCEDCVVIAKENDNE